MALCFLGQAIPRAGAAPSSGLASWYGEEHRGKLMANGKRFNPDKFTAASWFYPLGTKVRVTLASAFGAAAERGGHYHGPRPGQGARARWPHH